MSIKISTTCKQLSSHGGLFIADKVSNLFSVNQKLDRCLPQLKIAKANSFEKFKRLVSGLIVGADCLDDMNTLSHDPVVNGLSDVFTARTYGNFLRQFDQSNLHNVQS